MFDARGVAEHEGVPPDQAAVGVGVALRPAPDGDRTRAPVADTRSVGPGTVVAWALGASVLAMVVLHLLGAARLDPLTTTVSDYVSIPGGTALLALAVLGLATATAAVTVGVLRAGAYRTALPYGFGCAGLLATIAFPTNAVGAPQTLDTVLHRYAAAAFFISLPIAAALTNRVLTDRSVGWLLVVSLLAGGAFLVSHVPLLFPGWPGAHAIATDLPRGLAERVLLGADMGLVAGLAKRVAR
jgi:hypothetical protein